MKKFFTLLVLSFVLFACSEDGGEQLVQRQAPIGELPPWEVPSVIAPDWLIGNYQSLILPENPVLEITATTVHLDITNDGQLPYTGVYDFTPQTISGIYTTQLSVQLTLNGNIFVFNKLDAEHINVNSTINGQNHDLGTFLRL